MNFFIEWLVVAFSPRWLALPVQGLQRRHVLVKGPLQSAQRANRAHRQRAGQPAL